MLRNGFIAEVAVAALVSALAGCSGGLSYETVDLTDTDGDGIIDSWDNCLHVPNPDQSDFDGNGWGDLCELDDDGDLVNDEEDNCPLMPNASQADSDGDGVGDACDNGYDSDGDGISDWDDNCTGVANADQANQDGDAFGDVCDSDVDGDGWVDTIDNCLGIANPDQTDTDRDGIGDPCEDASDTDGDGFDDMVDNCPTISNPTQSDTDYDGIGDACDAGVMDEDSFPGSTVGHNNVANDGFAFNRAVGHPNSGLSLFWDSAHGRAIVLYLDEWEVLFAHYFDGTEFSPPIELKSPDQRSSNFSGHDSTDDWFVYFQGFRVLFLNTAEHRDVNARARDGDAIILWSRYDYLPPAGADLGTDTNIRLYGTYFDASEADVPFDISSPTRNRGFETQATIIDFDNVAPSPVPDENVTSFGFASDSLIGTHELATRDAERAYPLPEASGESTSFVYLVWRKGQRGGSTLFPVADRLHALPFDMTAAGNAIPTQLVHQANELPTEVALDRDAGVDARVVVHNGDLLWKAITVAGADVLQATRFSASAPPATVELTQGQSLEVPGPGDVYGGDHGVSSLYALFVKEQRLWCAKSDLDAAHTVEAMQIDSPVGAEVIFDGSRISRSGSWIMPLWRQWVGGFDLVHSNAIQTRTPARPEARTLTASVAGAMRVANQASTSSVAHVTIQSELASGVDDPRRSIQSRDTRMNFVFQQSDPDDPLIQALMHNGVIIEPSVSAAVPPVARLVITWVLPNGVVDRTHTGFVPLGPNFSMLPVVSDLGINDGAPAIYYLRNDNNPLDPTAAGAFNEVRVFGYAAVDTGVPVLVSSDGATDEHAMGGPLVNEAADYYIEGGEFLHVRTTPGDIDVTSHPEHRGQLVHLFVREPDLAASIDFRTATWPRLVTRGFRKSLYDPDVPATFLTAHDPPLGEPPLVLGSNNVAIPDVVSPEPQRPTLLTDFTVMRGESLGIYFRSVSHLYYHEHDGSSWVLPSGSAEATLVDNLAPARIFPGRDQQTYLFPVRRNDSSDTMSGAVVFFTKAYHLGGGTGARRFYSRVHD